MYNSHEITIEHRDGNDHHICVLFAINVPSYVYVVVVSVPQPHETIHFFCGQTVCVQYDKDVIQVKIQKLPVQIKNCVSFPLHLFLLLLLLVMFLLLSFVFFLLFFKSQNKQ